jgi:oligoribonuclease
MGNGNGNDRLVWIDCEMTGLAPERDDIVEIACIVTEADLTELDSGISLVVKPEHDTALAAMDEVVVRMHTESGLIDEIPDGIPLADAEAQVLAYVQQHVPEARKAPLAGSSVYVDRGFLAAHMPTLDNHLHYRLVDVSSVKELVRRWFPRVYFATPEKRGNHRALGDIRESIAELRYYRDAIFVPHPGPDSPTAQALGQAHVVDHSVAEATEDVPLL